MKCPHCNAWSRVLETRDGIKRRRECANMHRWWTQEVLDVPLKVRRVGEVEEVAAPPIEFVQPLPVIP